MAKQRYYQNVKNGAVKNQDLVKAKKQVEY